MACRAQLRQAFRMLRTQLHLADGVILSHYVGTQGAPGQRKVKCWSESNCLGCQEIEQESREPIESQRV